MGDRLRKSIEALAVHVEGGAIDDCGRYVMQEQPKVVSRRLLDFSSAWSLNNLENLPVFFPAWLRGWRALRPVPRQEPRTAHHLCLDSSGSSWAKAATHGSRRSFAK